MCNFYDAHMPGKRRGYLSGAKLNLPKDYDARHKVSPTGQSPILYINKDGEIKSTMWTPYFEKKRCLVPVSAFYEHHTLSKSQLLERHDKKTTKVLFRIGLKSSDLFCFAGIYNTWKDPETGEEKLSHAILTSDPNETLAKIHNSSKRMAAILPETAYDRWMKPINNARAFLGEGLLQPWPDEDMTYFQITKVFDHGATGDELKHPVENPIEI